MPHTGTNRYPALHNAMWPGLVGKGPGSEPPIDLDTMLDLTAAAAGRRRRVRRRRPVSVRCRTSTSIRPTTIWRASRTIWRAKGLAPARWSRRCGRRPAAVRPWAARKSAAASHPGAQGLPHRRANCASWASGRMASCASIRPPAPPSGPRIRQATHSRIAETFREACASPKATASAWPPKAKSAGAACIAGGTMSNCWSWWTGRKTLGFQADMAHTLLFTLGYNAPEDRLLPEDFDWSQTEQLRRRAPPR